MDPDPETFYYVEPDPFYYTNPDQVRLGMVASDKKTQWCCGSGSFYHIDPDQVRLLKHGLVASDKKFSESGSFL